MNRLLSKIQYHNFEIGEFTDTKERIAQETLEMIRQFPWEAQREHIVINLTNPSVTLEWQEGDFLKVSLYYQGKFVLYYLNKKTSSIPKALSGWPIRIPLYSHFSSQALSTWPVSRRNTPYFKTTNNILSVRIFDMKPTENAAGSIY